MPVSGQAATSTHAAGAARAPVQKKPRAQRVGTGLAAPAAQPYPGSALSHSMQLAAVDLRGASEYLPPAHGTGATAPAEHQEPAGQSAQPVAAVVFAAAAKVPASHGVGAATPGPQVAPGGQSVGSVVFVVGQYDPAGHTVQAVVVFAAGAKEPAGHGVGFREPSGHEVPGGQINGAEVEQ